MRKVKLIKICCGEWDDASHDKRELSVCKDLGAKVIVYVGVQSEDQLRNLFLASTIFVMPSFHETFGLVYAEAMSQGLPVIYTQGQGFDRQFDEGVVGYHVDANNPKDIADKVLKILNNFKQISENCTTQCHKFDWGNIASQYYEIYEQISSALSM